MHRSPEPTDPHSGSTGHDPTAPRRFRAASMEEALEQARAELGPDIEIVEANRIRRGGVGGFFATDLGVELTVVPGSGASPSGMVGDWPGTSATPPSAHTGRDEFEQRLSNEFFSGRPTDDEFIDPVRGTVHRPHAADDRHPSRDEPSGLAPHEHARPEANTPRDSFSSAGVDAGTGDDFMHQDVSEFERIISRIGRDDAFAADTTPAGSPTDPRLDAHHPTHRTERTPLFDDQSFDLHGLDDRDLAGRDVHDRSVERREVERRGAERAADAPHSGTVHPDTSSDPSRRSDAASIAQALAAMQRAQAADALTATAAPAPATPPAATPPASASVDVPNTHRFDAHHASAELANQTTPTQPRHAPQHHDVNPGDRGQGAADADAAAWLERTLAGLRDGTAGEDAVLDGLASRRPSTPHAVPPEAAPDRGIAPIDQPTARSTRSDVLDSAFADSVAAHAPEHERAAPRAVVPDVVSPAAPSEPPAPVDTPAPQSPVGYAIDLTKDAAGGLISQLANVHTIDGSPLADIKALSVSVKMPDGAVVDFTAKLDRGNAAKRKG